MNRFIYSRECYNDIYMCVGNSIMYVPNMFCYVYIYIHIPINPLLVPIRSLLLEASYSSPLRAFLFGPLTTHSRGEMRSASNTLMPSIFMT